MPLNGVLKVDLKSKFCVTCILPTHSQRSIAILDHHLLMPERYQPHLSCTVIKEALIHIHTGLEPQSNALEGTLQVI